MLKPNNQDRHWTILESEYLIRRPWLTARKDRVRLPNGAENEDPTARRTKNIMYWNIPTG